MSREAMQMALEALESDPVSHLGLVHRKMAITALRQALVNADDTSQERVDEIVKDEHEPVAWANSFDLQNFDMKVRTGPDLHHTVPLYTAPPKREWVGLTDRDIDECYFAALVAAHEREACAKMAEDGLIGHTIAKAIRARGEQ
jgi:hypothetical protein